MLRKQKYSNFVTSILTRMFQNIILTGVSCIKCKIGSTIPFNFQELERFQWHSGRVQVVWKLSCSDLIGLLQKIIKLHVINLHNKDRNLTRRKQMSNTICFNWCHHWQGGPRPLKKRYKDPPSYISSLFSSFSNFLLLLPDPNITLSSSFLYQPYHNCNFNWLSVWLNQLLLKCSKTVPCHMSITSFHKT